MSIPVRRSTGAADPGCPRVAGGDGTAPWIISGLTLGSALVAWAVVAAWIDDNIVPRPLECFARAVDIAASGEAAGNFATTLAKIGVGFGWRWSAA